MARSIDNRARNARRFGVLAAAMLATVIGFGTYVHFGSEPAPDGPGKQVRTLGDRMIRMDAIIEGWRLPIASQAFADESDGRRLPHKGGESADSMPPPLHSCSRH